MVSDQCIFDSTFAGHPGDDSAPILLQDAEPRMDAPRAADATVQPRRPANGGEPPHPASLGSAESPLVGRLAVKTGRPGKLRREFPHEVCPPNI